MHLLTFPQTSLVIFLLTCTLISNILFPLINVHKFRYNSLIHPLLPTHRSMQSFLVYCSFTFIISPLTLWVFLPSLQSHTLSLHYQALPVSLSPSLDQHHRLHPILRSTLKRHRIFIFILLFSHFFLNSSMPIYLIPSPLSMYSLT